jgi:hypothetical protein
MVANPLRAARACRASVDRFARARRLAEQRGLLARD